MKRLIQGVGVNDADYVLNQTENGKTVLCPFYRRWMDMLTRCYSDNWHQKRPTYIGCSVCDEWLSFMNFKAWMIVQDWKGKQLDKDIIEPGNKLYSSDTCCFISQDINLLLTDSAAIRGKYPQGVYFNKTAGKFQAYIKISGIKKSLGYFHTSEEASVVYIDAKSSHILDIANEQSDLRVKSGLKMHSEILKA